MVAEFDSSVVVELTESDRPGAALSDRPGAALSDRPGAAPSEPLVVHTVHALKWCILCHSIKPPTS